MQDHAARRIEIEQQVLAPPRHAREHTAGQGQTEILRHGIAQTPLAHHHADEGASFDVGKNAATGNFDFG